MSRLVSDEAPHERNSLVFKFFVLVYGRQDYRFTVCGGLVAVKDNAHIFFLPKDRWSFHHRMDKFASLHSFHVWCSGGYI